MLAEAVVFSGAGRVELQNVDLPALAPAHVRIRSLCSGISAGTEGWALTGRFTWAKTPFPCIPGYQRVGMIEALGEGVQGWQVGERVFATRAAWQGSVASFWGAHAAVADTPVDEVYRLDPRASDLNAASGVVAQVGYNAASRLTLEAPGEWVLVMGDGMIGQSAAQAARVRGARVILAGHRAERLRLGQQHSADVVVNSRQDHFAETVFQVTGGGKVRYVLDSVQGEAVQQQYMPVLERGRSQIVYCGFSPGETWANMAVLQQQEITAHFVSGWTRRRLEATLGLMAAGQINLEPLITHLASPERAPELYRIHLEKTADILGMTIQWS